MENSSLKRKLGWLEAMLFISGVALLGVFFQARASSEQQREEAVQAFLKAGASQPQAQQVLDGEVKIVQLRAPDQELWNAKRIKDYEDSLKLVKELPLAILTIDKFNIQVPVYNGTEEVNLNRGVGRIKGTARIDGQGNLGIAGHRDGFFRPLKDIVVGDAMELLTTTGVVVYKVTSIVIVDPGDVSVLAPTEKNTITLVTCYPFYYVGHAPKRYIVKAEAEHFSAINHVREL
ncbi:MAG: class D sortase [Xanthomonadales bacterium]